MSPERVFVVKEIFIFIPERGNPVRIFFIELKGELIEFFKNSCISYRFNIEIIGNFFFFSWLNSKTYLFCDLCIWFWLYFSKLQLVLSVEDDFAEVEEFIYILSSVVEIQFIWYSWVICWISLYSSYIVGNWCW